MHYEHTKVRVPDEQVFKEERVAIPQSKVRVGTGGRVTECGSWRAGSCMNTNRDIKLFRKSEVRLKLGITWGKTLVLSRDFSQEA